MRPIIAKLQHRQARRLIRGPDDDRGEITSNLIFLGGMVLLAVTIVGIITAGATGFAEGIDFGL